MAVADLIIGIRELVHEIRLIREEIKRLHPIYARWRKERKVDEVLKPYEEKEVIRFEGAGYLFYAFLRSNNPDLTIMLDLYSDGVIDIVESIKTLYEKGYTQSIGGFRILKYSDTQKDYTFEYAPGSFSGTGAAFRGFVTLKLYNPTDTNIKYSYYIWILELPGW